MEVLSSLRHFLCCRLKTASEAKRRCFPSRWQPAISFQALSFWDHFLKELKCSTVWFERYPEEIKVVGSRAIVASRCYSAKCLEEGPIEGCQTVNV